MITINTNQGRIRISKLLSSIILTTSTTLVISGCSNELQKNNLEINKTKYTKEQMDEMPSNKEYKLKNQSGNSKIIVDVYDINKGINQEYRDLNQIKNVRIIIKDEFNNIVDIFTTEEKKEYIVRNITPGKYTLEILDIPENYQTIHNEYSFFIENPNELEKENTTINYLEIPLEKKNSKKLVKTK